MCESKIMNPKKNQCLCLLCCSVERHDTSRLLLSRVSRLVAGFSLACLSSRVPAACRRSLLTYYFFFTRPRDPRYLRYFAFVWIRVSNQTGHWTRCAPHPVLQRSQQVAGVVPCHSCYSEPEDARWQFCCVDSFDTPPLLLTGLVLRSDRRTVPVSAPLHVIDIYSRLCATRGALHVKTDERTWLRWPLWRWLVCPVSGEPPALALALLGVKSVGSRPVILRLPTTSCSPNTEYKQALPSPPPPNGKWVSSVLLMYCLILPTLVPSPPARKETYFGGAFALCRHRVRVAPILLGRSLLCGSERRPSHWSSFFSFGGMAQVFGLLVIRKK
eukprot:TRINITY_DN13606_c0_g1_i1.p1 TRINITY_DN13606_c0_g1~~TRINITY_DN13606_c0_g1_i1.p1  ORF type:complete len:329 (+),score=-73.50 TRINITY_DN13606_c0_g1_i1:291-1277(+)